MGVAGAIALAIGLVAAAFVLVALITDTGGTLSGYLCFGLLAVLFVFAGVSMLAGSRVMPDRWPPRDDED